jgi:hypothetical protein
MSSDNLFEIKIGKMELITFISIIFEIVKVIWTVFSVSGWGINNSFLYYLYVIGLLILDTITIKALVNYLISLHKHKNDGSYMNSFKIRSFKYGLDEWVIILLISGFSTIIYYNELQTLNRHSHNYLLSKKFTKRLPFYLSIVFDIICGLIFYYNAKKRSNPIIGEKEKDSL